METWGAVEHRLWANGSHMSEPGLNLGVQAPELRSEPLPNISGIAASPVGA